MCHDFLVLWIIKARLSRGNIWGCSSSPPHWVVIACRRNQQNQPSWKHSAGILICGVVYLVIGMVNLVSTGGVFCTRNSVFAFRTVYLDSKYAVPNAKYTVPHFGGKIILKTLLSISSVPSLLPCERCHLKSTDEILG